MGENSFIFKQFRVEQDGAAMKVNTDGVLLGAWFTLPSIKQGVRVLDVGTGTGVIAIMAAQRLFGIGAESFRVDAVEIDSHCCTLAAQNFENSPWRANLALYHTSFQNFTQEYKYSLILSNPPYFNNALKNPDGRKSSARHTVELSHNELIEEAFKRLSDKGVLVVVLPISEIEAFIQQTSYIGFTLTRLCKVFTKSGDSSPMRALAEFTKMYNHTSEAVLKTETLTIMNKKLSYTEEYRELTKNFYLKF